MERFARADRAFCMREFYKNRDSAIIARKKLCSQRGLNKYSLHSEKFEETGSTMGKPKSERPRSSRSYKYVDSVNQQVRDPKISICGSAIAWNLHRSSLHRFLHTDLKLDPYKTQLIQELKPQVFSHRLQFVNQETALFNIYLFSNEAHFHLNRHVNKQNCSCWSATNPKNSFFKLCKQLEVD